MGLVHFGAMKAAFVIFDDLTVLDFIGPYDALTRLRTMQLMPAFASASQAPLRCSDGLFSWARPSSAYN